MTTALSSLKLKYWYHALIAISFSIFLSNGFGLLERYPTTPTALVSLGSLIFGLGEWLNHPFQTKIINGLIGHGHARRANFCGSALGLIGLTMCAYGIYLFF
jgi:hypothetical protein